MEPDQKRPVLSRTSSVHFITTYFYNLFFFIVSFSLCTDCLNLDFHSKFRMHLFFSMCAICQPYQLLRIVLQCYVEGTNCEAPNFLRFDCCQS
jgi:hypothetical protein